MRSLNAWLSAAVLLMMVFSTFTLAQTIESPQQAQSLDELLESVKQQRLQQRQRNLEREQEFLRIKQRQQALLDDAKAKFNAAQQQNNPLQKISDNNQQEIEKLKQQIIEAKRDLGDVYSIFAEFSVDFSTQLNASLISSQFPKRAELLNAIQRNHDFASIGDMEMLWLLVQEEMTAAATTARYTADVVTAQGEHQQLEIVRIGPFLVSSAGTFLRYVPEINQLMVLSRQPAGYMQSTAAEFQNSTASHSPMVLDPTAGSLLGMMSFAPSVQERLQQGGLVGYLILVVGGVGLLLSIWRLGFLSVLKQRVNSQMKSIEKPKENNPLGRIIKKTLNIDKSNYDSYVMHLSEAVLDELPRLQTGHNFIKLLAAIAPLKGLLGTVIGMIITFQSISLFGNGDPKLMAEGISQALITTVLGLVVAIPLLLLHSAIAALAQSLHQRLDEQCAGILARYYESAAA